MIADDVRAQRWESAVLRGPRMRTGIAAGLVVVSTLAGACSSGGSAPVASLPAERPSTAVPATAPPPGGTGGAGGGQAGGASSGSGGASSGAGDAAPQVAVRPARPPDANGWYRSAVAVAASARDDRSLSEVCFAVVPNYPDGTGASSLQQPCPAPGRAEWTSTAELREEARHIVQLWAVDDAGQQTNHDIVDLRLDLTPPASAISTPTGPFAGGSVKLDGSVSDASSGAAAVHLTLTGPGGERRERAVCTCSPAYRTRRPPEPFSWEGRLPAGEWTVRIEAADHAGHREAAGPSATFTVA